MSRPKGPYLLTYAKPAVIQALMTLRGITGVRDLARKSGVTADTAQRFISGKMVDVVSSTADKFAATLGVETGFLFIEPRSSLRVEDLAA